MPKDLDDIYKKVDISAKELNSLGKDQDKIHKEVLDLKKQIKDISFKVDTMLEILNNFTIMLAEDDEDLEENYDFDNDSDESWVPKEDDFWEDDNDESI
jgi:hypothetical protein